MKALVLFEKGNCLFCGKGKEAAGKNVDKLGQQMYSTQKALFPPGSGFLFWKYLPFNQLGEPFFSGGKALLEGTFPRCPQDGKARL